MSSSKLEFKWCGQTDRIEPKSLKIKMSHLPLKNPQSPFETVFTEIGVWDCDAPLPPLCIVCFFYLAHDVLWM